MDSDFFVVFSLSRVGSSALYRALIAHSKIHCRYEPAFAEANWDEKKLCGMIDELRAKYSGIKHVWDPSGWPFRNSHISIMEDMDAIHEKVLKMNTLLLSGKNQKVLFLRRRNQLARVLSDLLGQQTDLWTPAYPGFSSARVQSVMDEARQYRSQIRTHDIKPVEMDIITWYVKNIPLMEHQLRASVADSNCMDLYYEELFNPRQGSKGRLRNYTRILEFLGIPQNERYWKAQEIDALFNPGGKLNDGSTLRLIPNLGEIEKHFGKIAN